MPDARKLFGYEIRQPFETEQAFFRQNPQVAGMAAEDNKIVLNPHSPLSKEELDAVAVNEAARLWMRENNPALGFELTPQQKQNLSGTMYGSEDRAAKETIIGRILSGDPTAGSPTAEQMIVAEEIKARMVGDGPKGGIDEPFPDIEKASFADGAFAPEGIGATLGSISENYAVTGAAPATVAPQAAVGDLLSTLGQAPAAPALPAPVPVRISIDTTRGAPSAPSGPSIIPWSEIEEQPGFQSLSAHGKRQIRSQYLADIEKYATAAYKKPKDREEFVQTTLGFVGDYKDPKRTTIDWLNDFNVAIQSGVATVTGSVGEMLGVGGGKFEGDPGSLENLFNPAAQEALKKGWTASTSLASEDFRRYKAEREAKARAEGRGEIGAGFAVAGAYADRPGDFLLAFGEQIPIIGAFVGPGGLIRAGTRLATGAPKAIEGAVKALRAGTLSAEEAATAIKAAEVAGTRAGQLYTGSMGAVLGSADSKQQFVERLQKIPPEAWMSDPEYAAAVNAGEDPKAVMKRLAEDRSGWAAGLGALAGVFSGISGFERLFVGPAVAGMRRRLASAAAEPLTESLENVVGLGAGNLQAQGLDPKAYFTQGFGPAIAEAVMISGPFAAAAGAFPGGPPMTAEDLRPLGPQPEQPQPAATTAPPAGAPAAPAEVPSAIATATTARDAARQQVADGQAVIDNPASTQEEVTAAQQQVADANSRANGLDQFIERWNAVPAIADLARDIARDERRIASLEADTLADPDAKAREIGALQGRIEGKRALEAVNSLDENQLEAYIESRNNSLAAADAQRGLGITVDKARLTNEIAHAQRLLEERAEIPTPPEVEFSTREPTVFDRDPAGVPIWPDTNEVHGKPFMESINLQRDKALSLINLVRGNPQFTRAQRTAAITRARAQWQTANRVASAWNLPDEELAARKAELTQALGSGMTGAVGINPGHFAELAGVIAAQSERGGNPMTYRQAVLEAQRQIAAIYVPPTIIGPGSMSSQPDNPAGDTNKTYFYDDKPTVSGGRVLGRTPTDEEKKLWNNTITALVKLGFNRTALDALGLRIATSEYALGLYLPSGNDKITPNISYTLSVSWAKHTQNDAKGRQWTAIHEIHHALADSARNGTDISEVDPRFRPGGEFRTELEAAYQNGNGPLSRLDYPLNKGWGYSDGAIAAELWAQSGAYYFLDKNLLKQHAPKTFAFVESFHANLAGNQFTTRPAIAAAVQAGFSGVPPAPGVPVGQPPGGPPGAPGAGPVAGPAGPQPPPAGPPSAGAGGVGAGPLLSENYKKGLAVGQDPAAQSDPGLQAWTGVPAERVAGKLADLRAAFALPAGPGRNDAMFRYSQKWNEPAPATWEMFKQQTEYQAGLAAGLGKPTVTQEQIDASFAVSAAAARATSMLSPQRAAEAQGRLAADAIATVEAKLAQEQAARAPGGEGAGPVEPARRPQGVSGAAPEPAVAAAARAGEAAQAAPVAAAGPVRPPARRAAKAERAGEAPPAPARRAVKRKAAPKPLEASAVKVGDRVLDEGGDRVTVTEITKDGKIFVRGAEGFEYETRAFAGDADITSFVEPGKPTGAMPQQTQLQDGLADRIARLDTTRAEIADEIERLEGMLDQVPDEMVDEVESIIEQQKGALADAEFQAATAEEALARTNWVRRKVGDKPSTKERFEKVLGNIFGILPSKVKSLLPSVEVVTTNDIDPNTMILKLSDGTGVRVSGSQLAFYLPSSNKMVFIADNSRSGTELRTLLHELFHKRGHQLLGRQQMNALRREAEAWRNAPEGSIERKIYNDAMPGVMQASEDGDTPAKRKAIYEEELLPYFISSAVEMGVMPQKKNMTKKGADGWMARAERLYRSVIEKITGRKMQTLTAEQLISAAWGAAQLERGAVAYEVIAAGGKVTPPRLSEKRAASFIEQIPMLAQRVEEIRQRRGLRGPEFYSEQDRVIGGAMTSSLDSARVAALRKAPKEQAVQAAAATPAVGPDQPQFSMLERFAPKEAKPILTRDELSDYLATGNRPTVSWMQQTRDRQVENYIDHQRPFFAWLKRHTLPMTAWAKLKLVPGRLKARGETYSREILAPLERGIATLAKSASIPIERAALDVGWWATLRHIPEANAALRQKFQQRIIAGDRGAVDDLRNHDIAQRGQGDGPLAGGLSNTQAAANMAALEKRYTPAQVAEIKRMGDEIVAAYAKLKADAVKSGQISAEALRQFPNFKHYVALTGPNQGEWDNQASDAFGSYIAENRLREREGRTSSVANSSLEALADRIGRVAAYDASADFKRELNNIYEKAGGENNTIGLERFTANLVQSPKKSDIVWNSPEGKRYVFRFSEGSSIGDALLSKNREYHETLGLKMMDAITRKFSRAVTQWILAFGPINAVRDIQEKAVLIRSKDVRDAAGNEIDANAVFKATWKYWLNPDTWRAAKQIAFSQGKRADNSTQIGRYSNELLTEGGVSTWGEKTAKGIDSIEESIQQEARRAGLGRGDQNSLQKVSDFVRNYNLLFEIMSSLSVNAAMRDLGVPAKDAAFQTLDLMNFQNVGARTGWLRAAFSFFNPAAQSGYNLYRQIMHSKRGRRDFIGLMIFSFFVQGLLRMTADDDEELGNELDQKGTWEIERNLPVNVLGLKMKLPVGFGAPQFAWSIMNSGYRWMSGRYDTADAVAQAGISVLKSFNPIPISEVGPTKQPISFLVKTFTPTVFRPAVDFMTDSDAWGGKLTAYFPDKTKFRSEQGRPTTSVFYKDLASGMKDLGMDLYPEQVKALAESVAWGPFGYILQGVSDWNKENEGRRLNPMDKLPASAFLRFLGASRFVGGESRYLEARYYETYDKALNDLREFNEAKTRGREAQWRSENPEKASRVVVLQDQERSMRALSKEFNSTVKALQSETLNVDRARPALESIQNRREAAMRKFLQNLRVWQEDEDDEP